MARKGKRKNAKNAGAKAQNAAKIDVSVTSAWKEEFASTGFGACPKCSILFSVDRLLRAHFVECHGTPKPDTYIECPSCKVLVASGLSYITHHRRYHPDPAAEDQKPKVEELDDNPKRRLRSFRKRMPSTCIQPDIPPKRDKPETLKRLGKGKMPPLKPLRKSVKSPKSDKKKATESQSKAQNGEKDGFTKNPVKCGKCHKAFPDLGFFERHALSMHAGLARAEGESQDFTPEEIQERLKLVEVVHGTHVCPVCYQTFVTARGFNLHVPKCGQKPEEKPEICELCGCSRRNKDALAKHMETHHGAPAPIRRRRPAPKPLVEELAFPSEDDSTSQDDADDGSDYERELKAERGKRKQRRNSERSSSPDDDSTTADESVEPEAISRKPILVVDGNEPVGTLEEAPHVNKQTYIRALRKADSITCHGCGEVFKSYELFKRHKLFSHNGLVRASGYPQDFSRPEQREALRETLAVCKRLLCLLCKKKLHSVTAYDYHQKSCPLLNFEESILTRECPECNTQFKDLDLHLKHVHGIASKFEPEDYCDDVNMNDQDDGDDEEISEQLQMQVAAHPHYLMWCAELRNNGFISCKNSSCGVQCESVLEIYKHQRDCTSKQVASDFRCKICLFIAHDYPSMFAHSKEHQLNKRRSAVFLVPPRRDTSAQTSPASTESSSAGSQSVPGSPTLTYSWLDRKSGYGGPDVWLNGMKASAEFRAKRRYNDLKNVELDAEIERDPFVVIQGDDAKPYFPITRTSIQFCSAMSPKDEIPDFSKLNTLVDKIPPVQLDRFQGMVDANGVPTFFCGGPVQALDWCPMPDTVLESEEGGLEVPFASRQFLAVASLRSMNSDLSLLPSSCEKAVVQIWEIDPSALEEPKMRLGICIEEGPVWDLKWMPSGNCAQNKKAAEAAWGDAHTKKDRLGVLAVACNDAAIRVYSIPRKALPPKTSVNAEYAHFTPNLTLHVAGKTRTDFFQDSEAGSRAGKITCLDWSRDKAHVSLVAGMTSGFLAVWNLGSRDPMLVVNEDGNAGGVEMLPAKFFKAHTDYITCVRFYPGTGNRHVASTGADRNLKVWDLMDSSTNLPVHHRSVSFWAEDMTWLGHYPLLATAEQCMGNSAGGSYVVVLGSNQQRLVASSSTGAWSISFSTWFNATVTQVVPDTVICFVKPSLSRLEDEKVFRKRRYLLSRSIVVPKKTCNIPNATATRTYERAAEHLKLCFVDMPIGDERYWRQWRGISLLDDPTPPGSVPLTTAKKLAWNNNLSFCTAIASGGQSGLCRILIIRGFENDNFRHLKEEITSADT